MFHFVSDSLTDWVNDWLKKLFSKLGTCNVLKIFLSVRMMSVFTIFATLKYHFVSNRYQEYARIYRWKPILTNYLSDKKYTAVLAYFRYLEMKWYFNVAKIVKTDIISTLKKIFRTPHVPNLLNNFFNQSFTQSVSQSETKWNMTHYSALAYQHYKVICRLRAKSYRTNAYV